MYSLNFVMKRWTYLVCLCVLALSCMTKPALSAASPAMDNKPVLDDAAKIWRDQAQDVRIPKHGGLYVAAVYVWNGRADQEYKPFHQWEIKFKTGNKGAQNIQYRVIPLDAEMNVQQLFRKTETIWQNLDGLAADAESVVSYKLNCSHIASYRMELKWEGGEQKLFAGSRFMLPIDARALEKQPYITVSAAEFKYKKSKKLASVAFYLCNVGGGAASGVEHTIEFLDGAGKAIHSVVYVPEKGELPAGYMKKQEPEFKGVPDFSNINIRTRQQQVLTYEIDGDSLVAKEDIGLTGLKVGDKAITGKITNGFKSDVNELLVTINFEDASGKPLKTIEVHMALLKAGETQEFSEPIEKSFAFKAYSMGYGFGAAK